jgi:hypothetical protein
MRPHRPGFPAIRCHRMYREGVSTKFADLVSSTYRSAADTEICRLPAAARLPSLPGFGSTTQLVRKGPVFTTRQPIP